MKLTIEVSEDEIKDALARHVRTAVADRVNQWGAKRELQVQIDDMYKQLVKDIVVEELKKAPAIRNQIKEQLTNKIKAQINALMKKGGV